MIEPIPLRREPPRPEAAGRAPTMRTAAAVALAAALLGLGLYVLSEFLRALVWAVILGIALWPLYDRARRRFPGGHGVALPALFTGLVALVFVIPFAALAFEAIKEAHGLLDWAKEAGKNGIPVPEVVQHLPYGAVQASAWWNDNLAHGGWAQEFAQRLDTASNRELGRDAAHNAVHRLVLFGFALLALFFVFRDGDTLVAQCERAGERAFGPRGERVAKQMVASVHGTVDGLVLVGLGEGALMGVVYWFAGVPHPILLGALTAVAAMIPFGAALAIAIATVLLLAAGSVTAAVIVAVAGFVVTFSADHFVRPALIGGTTKLPFLWVLLGILGGVETFGLLGLFVGPAVMSALILLWRDFTAPPATPPEAAA